MAYDKAAAHEYYENYTKKGKKKGRKKGTKKKKGTSSAKKTLVGLSIAGLNDAGKMEAALVKERLQTEMNAKLKGSKTDAEKDKIRREFQDKALKEISALKSDSKYAAAKSSSAKSSKGSSGSKSSGGSGSSKSSGGSSGNKSTSSSGSSTSTNDTSSSVTASDAGVNTTKEAIEGLKNQIAALNNVLSSLSDSQKAQVKQAVTKALDKLKQSRGVSI